MRPGLQPYAPQPATPVRPCNPYAPQPATACDPACNKRPSLQPYVPQPATVIVTAGAAARCERHAARTRERAAAADAAAAAAAAGGPLAVCERVA